jgi:serine protease Do
MGKAVNNSADLPRMVAATKPGTRVTLQVWRKGKVRDIAVLVGQIVEEKPVTRSARGNRVPEQAANRLGLIVGELTPEQRRELRLEGGLLIEEVRNASARADLRQGDIIVAVISKGATHRGSNGGSVEQTAGLVRQGRKHHLADPPR